jgi:hypothetical protein
VHGLVKAIVKHIIYQVWIEKISNCICDIVLLDEFTLFSYFLDSLINVLHLFFLNKNKKIKKSGQPNIHKGQSKKLTCHERD